ncbi:response regulator [Desulfobacterales bacterium HSG17]|nr:response regulator [Desulfobacterales bacterium HSG17]
MNEKYRILIVDDEQGSRDILKGLLFNENYDLFFADNGPDALKKAEELMPDLILLDVMMPDMNGFEVCRCLRNTPILSDIHVFMVTVLDDKKTRMMGIEAGADDFISKPVDKIELRTRVRSITRLKRYHRLHDEMLEKQTHDLKERIKELNCLYSISGIVEKPGISLEEIIQQIVKLIPPSWEYSEISCAQITYDKKEFKTDNFKSTPWNASVEIHAFDQEVGTIEVCYLEKIPERSHWPFQKEEYELLNAIAKRIGKIIERKQTEHKTKDLEKQLRHIQKMEAIATLSGGIAHDFNNILFPVIGYTEMALDTVPEKSETREYLNEILKGVLRARDLVTQILTFSSESEREQEPVNIAMLAKEVLKLLKSTLPSTIEIRQNMAVKTAFVKADPSQLHQVIMNLCTNAYHAMRETGGILEVCIENDDCACLPSDPAAIGEKLEHIIPCFKLIIRDTGHGMKPAVKERIFEPYFTTKKQGEGTGIGLSVVYGIIKNLGGYIKVDSQPGMGTEFQVHLPQFEKQIGQPESINACPPPKGNEKILIVDDEERIINMLTQMLEKLGYYITAFNSSTDALENFRMHPDKFDLVITDMTMPGMTGDQLAQKMIKIRKDIPVILCTGFSEMVSQEIADSIGIREYIMKPVSQVKLAESIRRVLD